MGIATGRSTYPGQEGAGGGPRWGSAGIAEAIGLVADAELAPQGRQRLAAGGRARSAGGPAVPPGPGR